MTVAGDPSMDSHPTPAAVEARHICSLASGSPSTAGSRYFAHWDNAYPLQISLMWLLPYNMMMMKMMMIHVPFLLSKLNATDDGSDDSRGPSDLIGRTQEGTSGGAGDPLCIGHRGVRLQSMTQYVQPCVGSELSSAALGMVRVDDPCSGPQRETAVRSLRWDMDDMIAVS
jgi:hypothetical protein